jgi:Fe-S cluster biogenesis protein NfuA
MLRDPMIVDRIEQALDEIRPALEQDGGTIELLEITPGMVARLSFLGACVGCPVSSLTFKLGVERLLKQRVPELAGVEAEGMAEPRWD